MSRKLPWACCPGECCVYQGAWGLSGICLNCFMMLMTMKIAITRDNASATGWAAAMAKGTFASAKGSTAAPDAADDTTDAAVRDEGTDDGGNGLPPDDEPDLFSQEEQTE